MQSKAIIVVLLILAGLLITTPVSAGGGLVSWESTTTDQDFNNYKKTYVTPGTQYVVRPFVKQENGDFCRQCQITIKLEDPQTSDYIAQSSQTTDGEGTMYAKIISNVPGIRYAYAEVIMPNGSVYTSSKLTLNYSNQIYLPTPVKVDIAINPTSTPTATPRKIEEASSSSQELEVKVASLEARLEASEGRQTILEIQLNNLLNWFKFNIPFFN